MTRTRIALLAALPYLAAAPTPAQTTDPARLAAAVEPRIARAIGDGRIAGMSVAVVRGRDTLLLRSYGRADLELNVPTPDEAVYQVASITKQFTAASILRLQEEGKLSLDDDITQWLPDYPTRGRRIPLRRLMDHTSGIRAMHTSDPEFQSIMTQVLPADTLVRLYAAQPFDFEPGTAMLYNNTAYYILGLVVEKASGMPLAEYVRRTLLAPAGMRSSSFCRQDEVVPGRTRGYDPAQEGGAAVLTPARYVDLRWGGGAGALCSTTRDLVAWAAALHGGRILGADAYRQLVTPEPLADGTLPRYAKGLAVESILGHRALHHTGAIFGFGGDLTYFPDDSLTIVVLMNTRNPAVNPGGVAEFIARIVLGDATPPAAPFTGRAREYAGEYRGAGATAGPVLTVAVDSAGRLTGGTGGGRGVPLTWLGGETFARNDTRWTFVRTGGRVTAMRVDGGTTIGLATRQPGAAAGSIQ